MITGFERYKQAIAALPPRDRYAKEDLLVEQFHMFSDGPLDIYYCPFDYVNCDAELVLVGITPGFTQMELAFRTARNALAKGLPDDEVLRRVDAAGSFGGPMRKNPVAMPDDIGLPDPLRIPSSARPLPRRTGIGRVHLGRHGFDL